MRSDIVIEGVTTGEGWPKFLSSGETVHRVNLEIEGDDVTSWLTVVVPDGSVFDDRRRKVRMTGALKPVRWKVGQRGGGVGVETVIVASEVKVLGFAPPRKVDAQR